jgi:hypothetical protein
MRIIVCGSRDYRDVPKLWHALDEIDAEAPMEGILVVMDGASDDVTGPYVGADYWANQWALARRRSPVRFHAEWKKHGRAAGPMRNTRMLEWKPDVVVAFPGGRGTADMVSQARAAGVKVIEIA